MRFRYRKTRWDQLKIAKFLSIISSWENSNERQSSQLGNRMTPALSHFMWQSPKTGHSATCAVSVQGFADVWLRSNNSDYCGWAGISRHTRPAYGTLRFGDSRLGDRSLGLIKLV